ncbi:lactate oxidase [Latilactobacillus curvatus]|uniref:lactate oxidase n=1 Tax=Latilactobacillus curvatus TaxID=28038 RepID=UPI0020C7E739|nr:lactate oxidase [Latilactobacillus curvatus]MCP8861254.1 lactate oxidase [Latilactobacillus curvatus]MCP8867894.1 lactate oxidase [Latilactobacillus curvatus]MCP8871435.1 lactate oxidase [Latilactobacillus curvatus]MCP8880547.1 lactate oxidase [Latilactobacillus curvatus]
MGYHTSEAENPIDILNLASLEGRVKERMEAGAFGYIRGGAEDEWTMAENTSAFNTKKIMPRVLKGIDHADLHTKLWDIDLKTPIIQAPSATQGLAHEKGEVDTAKGVAAAGSIFSISTYANTLVEDAAAAAPDAPKFFQLYMSKDDQFNEFLLKKAVKAGVKAIILTVDSTLGGYREADIETQFPLPMPNLAAYSNSDGAGKGISEIYAAAKQGLVPEDIQKIKQITNLPVFVKGIQSPVDAEIAIQAGADGIWVSNHGGRQLDGGPASFEVLPLIAQQVAKRVPIVFDSGIRRGEHVFKALASGADLVAIGRPIIYGLNLGGAQGVQSVFEHLNHELSITMQLAGTKTIDEVKETTLLD